MKLSLNETNILKLTTILRYHIPEHKEVLKQVIEFIFFLIYNQNLPIVIP